MYIKFLIKQFFLEGDGSKNLRLVYEGIAIVSQFLFSSDINYENWPNVYYE